jgi:UPF0716 family protein affecting phage T7 exclusion
MSLPIVWWDTSPTLAIAVGASAGMAAQTRLVVAPILFGSLLVGTEGLDAVPAAVARLRRGVDHDGRARAATARSG